MIGETISHYHIIGKIGEGGMGVVYKAEDTQLKRTVALKFLPSQYTADGEMTARFMREAQAAAQLNHPHIITVYEIGEYEDQAYIAMEYVPGRSLRDVIKQGEMSIDSITDIACQLCDGLYEAHRAGIVHRDLKPENILLDPSNRVKIVDFGLARIRGATQLTRGASTPGTLRYMSPEQCQHREVDHRTDIWSLGVVLFEMLTGQLPFQGEYEAAVMYSVVNEEPKSLNTLRQDIPENLDQIVSKFLVKDPAMRYQSMQEVIEELKKPLLSMSVSEKKEKSIVVLPFDDMSPNKDNEYFSDGLTEEIITDLSHIHDLRVISRNSAMMLKGTRKETKNIARELNVQYVLEGSVRKAGDNLRITAQLINALTDDHLWAEKYSGTLDDIFDIQEKVSRSIVDALKLKLNPEESRKIAERPIDNVQAYELHLRARYDMLLFTEEAIGRALQLIKNGLEIIGENEIFYADLGLVYLLYYEFISKEDRSFFDKADDCVKKVFALNPESSHGHCLKGNLYLRRGNIQEAAKEFRRALAIDPFEPNSLCRLGWVYALSGKGFTARSLFCMLLEIDPLTPLNHMILGALELVEGKFNTGLKHIVRAHELERENPLFRYWYAKGLAYDHRYEEAYRLFNLIEKDTNASLFAKLGTFFKYALQGKKEEALQSATDDLKSVVKEDEFYPIWMAESYALIEEKEEAIDWLEHGISYGFIHYPWLSENDPFLNNIRGEERFKKLMERVKYEWEHFEV